MKFYTLASETKTFKITSEAVYEALKIARSYSPTVTERIVLDQIREGLELNLNSLYGLIWERHNEWYDPQEMAQYLEYRRVY